MIPVLYQVQQPSYSLCSKIFAIKYLMLGGNAPKKKKKKEKEKQENKQTKKNKPDL